MAKGLVRLATRRCTTTSPTEKCIAGRAVTHDAYRAKKKKECTRVLQGHSGGNRTRYGSRWPRRRDRPDELRGVDGRVTHGDGDAVAAAKNGDSRRRFEQTGCWGK